MQKRYGDWDRSEYNLLFFLKRSKSLDTSSPSEKRSSKYVHILLRSFFVRFLV